MKFTLRVDYVDGTMVETTAVTADIIDFEAEWSRSILTALEELRATDAYWLAWKSLSRAGETDKGWRDWLAIVDNVKMLTEEAEPRPLARGSRRRSTSSDSPTTSTSPSLS